MIPTVSAAEGITNLCQVSTMVYARCKFDDGKEETPWLTMLQAWCDIAKLNIPDG